MESKPKRILHVVSAMHRGGAETMIMNLYRNIDRTKIQFDFIVHARVEGNFDDEIMSLGGRIIKCDSLGSIGPFRYVRRLSNVIKENGPFHAVHSHTDFQGGFVALAAKKAGISTRICHSHNTQWVAKPNIIHNIQLAIFKEFIDRYATDFCACGKEAAKFLFKKNKVNSKVKIINNGIEVKKFMCDSNSNIRKEFNISEDTFIIGNIARFAEQKNHKFIIKLAQYLREKNVDFVVLLVGQGSLLEDIKLEVRSLGLSSYIRFLGVREDITMLLNSFNVFVMPSFYEGLPVVLVEAQAARIPCVIATTISEEVDFGLGLIRYCKLSDSIEVWEKAMLDAKGYKKPCFSEVCEKLKEKGYDAKANTDKLIRLYGV